jgi:RimJ/RimL family protein N-acetyltransferase
VIVHGQAVVDWCCRTHGIKTGYTAAIGIGVTKGGELQGAVVYHEFNGASIRIHVVSNGSKRWVTREWLHVIFSYAFDQLKVKRITGFTPASNCAALKFNKSVGLVEETRLAGTEPDGDTVVLKMTRADCRWIDYSKFPGKGKNV